MHAISWVFHNVCLESIRFEDYIERSILLVFPFWHKTFNFLQETEKLIIITSCLYIYAWCQIHYLGTWLPYTLITRCCQSTNNSVLHLFLPSFVLTSWKNLTQCFHWLWHAEMILSRKLEQTLWRPVVKWQQLSWRDCKREARSFLPKHPWPTYTRCSPQRSMSSSILCSMIIWWKKTLRSECQLH